MLNCFLHCFQSEHPKAQNWTLFSYQLRLLAPCVWAVWILNPIAYEALHDLILAFFPGLHSQHHFQYPVPQNFLQFTSVRPTYPNPIIILRTLLSLFLGYLIPALHLQIFSPPESLIWLNKTVSFFLSLGSYNFPSTIISWNLWPCVNIICLHIYLHHWQWMS